MGRLQRSKGYSCIFGVIKISLLQFHAKAFFLLLYIYAVPFSTLAAVPVEKLSENYVFLNYRKKLKNTIEIIRRICYTITVVEIREATNDNSY